MTLQGFCVPEGQREKKPKASNPSEIQPIKLTVSFSPINHGEQEYKNKETLLWIRKVVEKNVSLRFWLGEKIPRRYESFLRSLKFSHF